jgi:hypothetical protein
MGIPREHVCICICMYVHSRLLQTTLSSISAFFSVSLSLSCSSSPPAESGVLVLVGPPSAQVNRNLYWSQISFQRLYLPSNTACARMPTSNKKPIACIDRLWSRLRRSLSAGKWLQHRAKTVLHAHNRQISDTSEEAAALVRNEQRIRLRQILLRYQDPAQKNNVLYDICSGDLSEDLGNVQVNLQIFDETSLSVTKNWWNEHYNFALVNKKPTRQTTICLQHEQIPMRCDTHTQQDKHMHVCVRAYKTQHNTTYTLTCT